MDVRYQTDILYLGVTHVNVALGHDSLLGTGEALVEGGVVDIFVKEIKTILELVNSLANMLHIIISIKKYHGPSSQLTPQQVEFWRQRLVCTR